MRTVSFVYLPIIILRGMLTTLLDTVDPPDVEIARLLERLLYLGQIGVRGRKCLAVVAPGGEKLDEPHALCDAGVEGGGCETLCERCESGQRRFGGFGEWPHPALLTQRGIVDVAHRGGQRRREEAADDCDEQRNNC